MYDYLSGTLAVRKPNYVVIDAGGVGYRVEIPLSSFQKLPKNGSAKIFTYLKVAENDMKLYGFATERERDVFLRLIDGVPQLGPSKAIAILSSLGVDELMQAVEDGDPGVFRKVKGVGPKIANRLVLELKGTLPESLDGAGTGDGEPSITRDAAQALISLGFDRVEAETRVRKARKGFKGDVSLEELLKKCLATL